MWHLTKVTGGRCADWSERGDEGFAGNARVDIGYEAENGIVVQESHGKSQRKNNIYFDSELSC
jgi:hypothetical protein